MTEQNFVEDYPYVRTRDLGSNPTLVSIVAAIGLMIDEGGDHHWEEQGRQDDEPNGLSLLLRTKQAIGDEEEGTHQQVLVQAERIDEGNDLWQLWVGYDPSNSITSTGGNITLPGASTPFSSKRSVFGSTKRWDPLDVDPDSGKIVDDERPGALTGSYRILLAEHRDNECASPSRPRTSCLTMILQRYDASNQAIIANEWSFHVGRIGSAFDALRPGDGANGDAVLVGRPADCVSVLEEGYWSDVQARSWLGQAVSVQGSAIRVGTNEWADIIGTDLDAGVLAGATIRTLTPASLQAAKSLESIVVDDSGYNWLMTSAGHDHTLGLDRMGRLWAWGDNSRGQLGLGDDANASYVGPMPVIIPEEHPGRWMYVSAGKRFSLALDENGVAWAWGSNDTGELGIGGELGDPQLVELGAGTNVLECKVPVRIKINNLSEGHPGTWSIISAGGAGLDDPRSGHSLGIDTNGKAWAWGNNDTYQLGDGTNQSRNQPTPVVDFDPNELISNWIQVSASREGSHSFAIDSLGRAWAWGDNFYGQLGIGPPTGGTEANYEPEIDRDVPVLVTVPVGHPGTWLQLSAGGSHSLGIDTDGKGWAWGFNGSGRLGDGTVVQQTVPTPTAISTDSVETWAQLSAGGSHSLGIDTDGKGWAWGNNGTGRLGTAPDDTTFKIVPTPIDTDSVETWSQLSAGTFHSLGISLAPNPGKGWAWGSNSTGQLGTALDDTTLKTVPTAIDTDSVQTWRQLSAGGFHSLGISLDPDPDYGWAWGFNGSGRLGDGTTAQRTVPTPIDTDSVETWSQLSAGTFHSLGISLDPILGNPIPGKGWAWGDNGFGRLGTAPGDTTQKTVPTAIDTVTSGVQTWRQLSAGGFHSLGISLNPNDGKGWAWGSNSNGQTGLSVSTGNQTTPIKFFSNVEAPPEEWVAIVAGAEHSLGISSDESGWGWGSGAKGKLGNGNFVNHFVPTRISGLIEWKQLQAGKDHAQGIDVDQNSWGWGSNEDNQLGLGPDYPMENITTPVKMGLKVEKDWIQVSASINGKHSLAIDSLGRAWAWGDNFYGQLGIGPPTGGTEANYEPEIDRDVPVLVTVPVGHPGTWLQVSAGNTHSLGIDINGKGWAWGNNTSTQLGIASGNAAPQSVPTAIDTGSVQTWRQLSAGGFHSLGISLNPNDGKGWAWGSNVSGRLGIAPGDTAQKSVPTAIDTVTSGVQTWRQLSAGGFHSLGISLNPNDGKGWAWGSNGFGRLGTAPGDTAQKTVPTAIDTVTSGVLTWKQLTAGNVHSLGISLTPNDGKGWAWGNNTFKQLGDNTNTSRDVPIAIDPSETSGVLTWKQLTAGNVHSLGISLTPNDGKGWGWGSNDSGILGDGNENTQPGIPTAISTNLVQTWSQFSIGSTYSLGISLDPFENKGWAWGRNSNGQTGLRLSTGNQIVPAQIQNPYVLEGSFSSGSAGGKHTILIDTEGNAWACGSNAQGQLSLGDSIANAEFLTKIGTGPSEDLLWSSAAAGHQHTVAIDADTGLWSWGSNAAGQLGLGDDANAFEPTLSPYLIAWKRTPISSEVARTKFVRRWGLSPINPNLKLFSATFSSKQAWVPVGNGSSQLILWRRGTNNEEV